MYANTRRRKTKYGKYQEGLMEIRNLITRNIEESFVLEHNNSISGFSLVNPIVFMDYIQTNYVTVLPKQLQGNITLDVQWEPTIPISVLFTCIEDYKLFTEYGEELFTDKNILRSAYLAIEDTGLFNLPCDTWQYKPTSAKNWSNFKLFFTKESANIKHHTTDSVWLNNESTNAVLQLSEALS